MNGNTDFIQRGHFQCSLPDCDQPQGLDIEVALPLKVNADIKKLVEETFKIICDRHD